MPARNTLLFVVLACWTLLNACVLDSAAPGDAAQITGFDLLTANNPELTDDVFGVITDTTVTLNVPADTDLTSLVPTIQHNGDHVIPAADKPQDFSDPVDYSVVAADGSLHVYRVTVVSAASSRKEIKGFRIDSVPGVINGTNITLTLPYGTDVSMLRGFVSYSGDSVSPQSGSVQDFGSPLEYTVTAQDGSTKTYTVIVAIAPSNAKDITELSIDDMTAEISGTQISLTLPNGTDVHALEPTIQHTGASISPESGSPQDFSAPVSYVVTAADGTTKQYTVTVTVAKSDAKEITKFTWSGRTATIQGDSITLTVPFGTDVTHISPTIVHTGKSVSPASGSAPDFSQPIDYTVTAADGSTRVYKVTVTVALDTAHEISEFIILGVRALISGTNLSLTLPFGTDPASLAPSISHTGKSVSPQSGLAQNFTSPVRYTVTAADGSTNVYTVTVTIAKSNAHEISAFSVLNVAGVFGSGGAIAVTVPFGSDVHAVVPALTHDGASIQPAADVAQDFRTPVAYTVTAADGSTNVYTVTVTVAASSAREITAFSVLGVAATSITASTIAVTVPFGSDVHAVAPMITHNGASILPAASATQDFRSPVMYTVTAADNSTRVYTVTVTIAPSSTREITAFSLLGVAATSITASTIAVTVPFGSDVHSVAPVLTHNGASILPAASVPQDFRVPVMYTVTASGGQTRVYTVTVTVAANPAKEITAFSIANVPGTFGPDSIALTLPHGSDLSMLQPAIAFSGASVSPASGDAQNFSSPVTYTVTADDHSTKRYVVTVSLAKSDTKAITGFSIGNLAGKITASGISVTVPSGTDITKLKPTVTIAGKSVEPQSGAEKDFTSPVTYTVKADDDSTKDVTVTVTLASASTKDITGFSIMGMPATITGNSIAITLPFGTDPTRLTPTVEHDGAAISPASLTQQNFSTSQTYRVTAADNSTQDYTVSVTIAANDAKDILGFNVLGVTPTIVGNTVTLTVPSGTSVTSLMPSVSISGASVSPASGQATDFTSPVMYTVTDANGMTKVYMVTVSIAP